MEYGGKDGKEEKELKRDDIKCPEGWLWSSTWSLDRNRAVDEEGELIGLSHVTFLTESCDHLLANTCMYDLRYIPLSRLGNYV